MQAGPCRASQNSITDDDQRLRFLLNDVDILLS